MLAFSVNPMTPDNPPTWRGTDTCFDLLGGHASLAVPTPSLTSPSDLYHRHLNNNIINIAQAMRYPLEDPIHGPLVHSGAEAMPKGSRLKRYIPLWVLIVVYSLASSSRRSWRYAWAKSNFVNFFPLCETSAEHQVVIVNWPCRVLYNPGPHQIL